MATIDNINTKLNNLKTYKTDIAAAITEKGVTVPSGTNYDGFAALIDKIESSSGTVYPNGKEWTATNISGKRIFHVCYTSSGWYAFSNDECIYKSADGKSWIEDTSISYKSNIFTALKGRTAIWTKHYYDGDCVSSSTEEIAAYTLVKEPSSKSWNEAITGSTVNAVPCFCTDIKVVNTGTGSLLVQPAGNIVEMDSGMQGSSFKSAWTYYYSENGGSHHYAYDAVNGIMYTTNTTSPTSSKLGTLYEITGVTENFDAYPECGLHTDGYYYIRRSIEYSNGKTIVRAPRDTIMSTYGLQYSTDNGTTWTNSNLGTSSSYKFDCVYYAAGMWVAGGSNGLYYSTNGKTWTASNMTEKVYALYYDNFMWVIGTNDGIYYSLAWELLT